jgi:hypothetical protein
MILPSYQISLNSTKRFKSHFTRQYNPEEVDNHFTRQYNPEEVDNHFTRQYNPEDSSEHHTRRRENLKSHMVQKLLVGDRQTDRQTCYLISLLSFFESRLKQTA